MSSQFILGWEEWVSLPALGLPAIKAKIDTGARTSALHAALIEPFGTPERPMVRFVVHPRPGRDELAVVCAAPVVDRREVTSSNGDSEQRYVIVTEIAVGGVSWPIEVTLTNRAAMSYRMLIGRQAIRSDMFVDAATSFRQPKLSFKLYGKPEGAVQQRPLRYAVLTRSPDASTVQRLAEAASARGHVVDLVDFSGDIAISLQAMVPGLSVAGAPVAHYDVVVPRLASATPELAAAVRQMELMGATAINSGNALDRLRNPYALAQALAKARIPVAGRLASPGSDAVVAAADEESRLQVLVVGRRDVAIMALSGEEHGRLLRRHHRAEAKLARRAAAALRLGLAAVDILAGKDGPRVAAVSSMPRLRRFQRVCRVDVMARVIEAGESRVRGKGTSARLAPPPLR